MRKDQADLAQGIVDELAEGRTHELTPEEIAALKEMAKVWRQIKGFLAVGEYLGSALKWMVGLLVAYYAFREFMADGVRNFFR
jgi:hypothetical protein